MIEESYPLGSYNYSIHIYIYIYTFPLINFIKTFLNLDIASGN